MASETKRPRSRRGHGDDLRTEVLDAVNRLLDRWGSDEQLTMRAVAQEVGVAAPSIYLHFADKSELVWAALADKYTQLAEQMRVAAAAADGPRERLHAQVHAYCRFAIDNPGHYRLMYEIRQSLAQRDQLGRHPAGQVFSRLRQGLADCAESGYPLALPLHQGAHTLWTALHGLLSIQHSLAMSELTPELLALADGVVDLIVSVEKRSGPAYPPQTEVDRLIAESVVEDY